MTCELFSATNRFSVIFVNIYKTFLVRHTFVFILWATFKLLSSFWTTAVSLLASTIVWRSKKTEEEEATTSSGQVQGGSSETWSQSSFCWMTTSKVFLQNFTKSRVNLTFDLFRIRKCHHVDFLSHGQKTYFCEVTMPPWPLTPDHPVLIRSSWSPSGCLCQIQSVPEKWNFRRKGRSCMVTSTITTISWIQTPPFAGFPATQFTVSSPFGPASQHVTLQSCKGGRWLAANKLRCVEGGGDAAHL